MESKLYGVEIKSPKISQMEEGKLYIQLITRLLKYIKLVSRAIIFNYKIQVKTQCAKNDTSKTV